jgi:GT2 family glycosyltransferase
MTRVYVVVLNFDRRDLTRRCVESLRRLSPAPEGVIVVDNGSSEQPGLSPEDLPERAQLLRLDTNLGYAGGNNAGIRAALEAGADVVWVLNNDAWVQAGALGKLLAVHEEPGQGDRVLLPLIQDGPSDRPWLAGGAVDAVRGTVRHDIDRPRQTAPFTTGYVVGCAPFVPAEVLRTVGGFDRSLFLYWEDAEWTLRLIGAGIRPVVVPEAVVAHDAGGSTGGGHSWRPFPRPYYKARNRLWLARRGTFDLVRTLVYTPRWVVRELRIEAREAKVVLPVGAVISIVRGLVAGSVGPLPRPRVEWFDQTDSPGRAVPRAAVTPERRIDRDEQEASP